MVENGSVVLVVWLSWVLCVWCSVHHCGSEGDKTAKCQNIGLKCELDTLLSELFRTGAVKIIIIRIVTAKSDRNCSILLSTLAAD